MQTADIIILVVVALPALVGVMYGFLNIAFSLLAWALSIGIAAKFTPFFSPMLENHIDTPIFRTVLAFIALFIISLVILTGIGFLLVKLLGRTGLTATDRILGFFFGIGLGAVIVQLVVFLAGFTAVPGEPWWEKSLIIRPFERIAVWSQRYLPESIVDYHSYESVPIGMEKEQYNSRESGANGDEANTNADTPVQPGNP